MRNLGNVGFARWSHADITAACWDPERDHVICSIGPTEQDPSIELLRVSTDESSSVSRIAGWDAPSPHPDVAVDRIIGLQYLGGLGTTCVVLEGGDILTVQDPPHSSTDDGAIEIVGSIDAGISSAKWSPDEELLLITTKADTAIFMSATFDPIAEVALTVDDLKASKHVSVGWGKKETQFQGRGAKALRDPTIPEKVDEGLPSAHEDGATSISWRGDGAFVAVNSVQQESRRVIRVYSRTGELDSASEPVDGLEAALSWRPSGNLIAGVQRLPAGRVDVVFFERNGLRHGQFTLRSPGRDVTCYDHVRLEWNSDSTVLAVVLRDGIQLWTMGNYHWYLKQEIPVCGDALGLAWHPEKALRSATVSSTEVLLMEQIFHTARGSCLPPYDTGAVAVIDGETIKLTPFRTANVPPPMSFLDVAVGGTSVVDVAFGHYSSCFAVLHRQGVSVFQWPTVKGRPGKPSLAANLPFPSVDLVPLRIWSTSKHRFQCVCAEKDSSYTHFTVSIGADALSSVKSEICYASTCTYEDEESLDSYGQDKSGKVYKISDAASDDLFINFPTYLPWFEVSKIDHQAVAFGLSRNGHIYANSRLLAKNCTSFVVSPSHLILTTSNHLVKYVHLAPYVEELEVPDDDPDQDERCRSVERGSRLVVAIPTNMSIVLQMPRGNIETIFPRAMVVAGIRNLIDNRNYARAFSYCRTQRVDMNILCDHQPSQFLANVGLFLEQLKDVSYIDLFLSSLRDEDVTQTMYRDTKRSQKQPTPPQDFASVAKPVGVPSSAASKVNIICDAVLKALLSRKASSSLQNIITAHVCKSPPALDDGLTLVAELMRGDDEKVAEKAVEHICFLVDVNRLYENALGLYNLDLALLVAQQSQRDPREYLPFIQDLHKLPELRRKFAIDDHLARWTKALTHLQALDAFDEFSAYTTKHALYQDALRMCRYDQVRLRAITSLYADYLESKCSYREAGLAYESLQNYAKATACYRAAGPTCWQECLFAAQQQHSPTPLSPEAMADLASNLADALWEAKDYVAAATIHLEHLFSLDTAAKCLCKGYHFAEAMRLVAQRNRHDLLPSIIDAGLAEAVGSTTEFLADCKAQLLAQVPRIADLRRKAIEDPLSFYEGEHAAADIPDDVSVATSRVSTSASLFTRYTGGSSTGSAVSRATSKNRKREEKKRARGRKGTVYEEEYLVNSVRRLIERVAGTTPEVRRLVSALVRRDMAERARAIDALMAEVVDACRTAVDDVFSPPASGVQEPQHADSQPWTATGGDAVLQDFIANSRKRQEPPVIDRFESLALLGG